MKRKVIWILNHHAVTPEIGGGTRHYSFARELVKRGYEVYIFASSHIHNSNRNLLENGEKKREDILEGIHWVWIKTRSYSGNGKDRVISMYEYYQYIMKYYINYIKPDVVIGSSVHPLACLAGIKISRKTGAKCISEIRDLWPQTLIDMGRLSEKGIIARVLYMLERYIYKKSESIIVTTQGMIDYINGTGVKKKEIFYINNGIDVGQFDKQLMMNDETVENIIKENADCYKCIYTGAIGEANCIDNLIESAKILRNEGFNSIKIIIVGDGPEKIRLTEKANQMELNNIVFYNPIRKDAIPLLLNHSDTNLFNLKDIDVLKYGLSANKMFDYMCSGKPIVFACKTTSDYVIESDCGISVPPENPKKMADAIVRLYNMDHQERDAMGKRGRSYVEKNFDISILVNKLEEVINS